MTEPTVNIPLLRKAVEWAEAEAAKPLELCEWEQAEYVSPKWRQELWRRTYEVKDDAPPAEEWFGRLALKSPDCGTCYCVAGYVAAGMYGIDEEISDVRADAMEALGLDEDQADDLFHDDNTIQDVRRIAESIAGERL